jgi:hypothetical protein
MSEAASGSGPTQWFRLRASGVSLPADRVLAEPAVMTVLVEDLCWQIACANWTARAPRWWRRQRRAQWRTEEAALRRQRHQARTMAIESGIPVE